MAVIALAPGHWDKIYFMWRAFGLQDLVDPTKLISLTHDLATRFSGTTQGFFDSDGFWYDPSAICQAHLPFRWESILHLITQVIDSSQVLFASFRHLQKGQTDVSVFPVFATS